MRGERFPGRRHDVLGEQRLCLGGRVDAGALEPAPMLGDRLEQERHQRTVRRFGLPPVAPLSSSIDAGSVSSSSVSR